MEVCTYLPAREWPLPSSARPVTTQNGSSHHYISIVYENNSPR